MSDTENVVEKKKRFRSPPYPMFDLGKAVERATEVSSQAHHHQVGAQVLSSAWGMKSADGKVWRAAAALIQYGLLIASGTGKTRKFQVSDVARRIIQDIDPLSQKRRDALYTAALSPMIHKELWEKFKSAKGLSDAVIKTYLTLDRVEGGEAAYSDSAADEVIHTYRATLAYAGISDSDTIVPPATDKDDDNGKVGSHSNLIKVKVGEYVQWTSNGQDQFKLPRKVVWKSDDGTHLRVHGTMTGIPANEVTVVDPPAPPPAGAGVKVEDDGKNGNVENDINVLVTNNGRLQITADVDEEGLKRLMKMLEKYEGILDLL